MAKSKCKTPRTHRELAQRLSVSVKTIANWRDSYVDWPGRNESGSFDMRRINAFCKRRSVGPCNPVRGPAGQQHRTAIAEASRLLRIEQAENERIKKERQLVEQTRELGGILGANDVQEFYRQTVAVVAAVQDDFEADVMALLGKELNAEEWPARRAAILELAGRLPNRTYEAMRELA